MKKYLQNRNEQLFNKLFESQGINISLEENEEDIPFNPDDDTQDQMDSDVIHGLETSVMDGVRNMIRQGASPQQMERLLKGVDAAILYGFAGSHGSYNSPFMGKSLEEIGVPEMTAWQAIEEEDLTESRTRAIIKEEWAKEGHQPLTEEQLDEILVEIFGNPFKKTGDKDGFDNIEAAQEIDATAKDAVMGLFKKFTTNNQRMKAMRDAFDALPIEKQKGAAEEAEKVEDKEDAAELATTIVDAAKDEEGEETASGELNLQTSRNEIDYTGIMNYLKGSKVDSGVTKNVSKILKYWHKKHLTDKNVKLTEDSERFFSSLLESFRAISRDFRMLEEATGGNSKKQRTKKKAADKKWTADVQKFKAFVDKNPQVQSLLGKIDTKMDVQGFMLAVIEMVKETSSPEDIIRALTAVLPIVKKDIQQDTGDEDSGVPLTKGGGSLGQMLAKAGLDTKIQQQLLKALAGQLQGNKIQFTEIQGVEEAVHVLTDPDTKEDEEEVELDTGELEDEFAADETAEEEDMLTEQIKPRKKGKTKRKVVIRYGKSKKTKRT